MKTKSSFPNVPYKYFYLLYKFCLILLFYRHFSLPGEYTIAGTQALYERDNHLEKIRIPGPILEPIIVYVSFAFSSLRILYILCIVF